MATNALNKRTAALDEMREREVERQKDLSKRIVRKEAAEARRKAPKPAAEIASAPDSRYELPDDPTDISIPEWLRRIP